MDIQTENTTTKSFRDLRVWHLAKTLAVDIYRLTEKFPKAEMFGLTSQMRRAAVSIPSNIAEGRMRGTRKDYVSFLRIANGSAAELETQLDIAGELGYVSQASKTSIESTLLIVQKMLSVMISKLQVKEADKP